MLFSQGSEMFDNKDGFNSLETTLDSEVLDKNIASYTQQDLNLSKKNETRFSVYTTLAAVLALVLISGIGWIVMKTFNNGQSNKNTVSKQASSQFSKVALDQLNLGQLGQLDVNGNLTVNGGLVLKPSNTPNSPISGQIYLNNQDKKIYYYDGENFKEISSGGNNGYIAGVAGGVVIGSGLRLQGNLLSAETLNSTPTSSPVTSVQGQSGNVVFTGGNGIGINGTQISNNGVTSVGGLTGNVPLGRGLAVNSGAVASSMTLVSGSPSLLTITEDGNGNYTISQVGSGTSGSVALGPTVAQTDASNFSSIFIDKTGSGNLLQIQQNGTDRWVVNNSGILTVGNVPFARLTGVPSMINNLTQGANTATGSVTIGSGLTLSGNTLTANASGVSSLNTFTNAVTINGTTNQLNVNNNSGVITLSLPQDINTNSTPTFSGLTLTSFGAGLVQSSSGGVLSSGSVDRNSATLFTNNLSVTNGGTGSSNASGARSNLGAAASGANSDITSLTGLTTALSVGQGGTGATTLGANGVLIGNGTGAISSVVAGGTGLCLTSTAGAPTWSACPGSGGVSSVNTFTGAVAIQGTANQVSVNNSSNTITLSLPQDLNTTSSPQFSNLTLTGNLTAQGGTGTFGTTSVAGGVVIYDGSSNTGTLQTAALGQNTTYTLPDPGLASATICLSTGNCAGSGGGVTTAGGTTGYLALFSGASSIGDSIVSQSGSTLTANGNLILQGANSLAVGTASTNDGSVTFYNNSGVNTVSLQSPNSNPSSNLVFRLPDADGSNGDCLKTDSAGNLSFGTCLSGSGGGGGGVVSLDGLSGSLTISNATGSGSNITIDDATTAAKGIASFSSSNFSVTSGAVTIATGGVTSAEIFNGTVTGTDIASSTVANSNLVNSSLTVTAGTGLSGGGSVALGSSTTLNVVYGSSAGNAVQGDTSLVCASGTGNLSGGGNTITLGSGGTCGNISIVNNPTFTTSVTTAQLIMTGAGSNGTLQVANLGQATAYTLPDPGVGTATICLSTGNCAGSGTGVTTAGGTTNALAKFTGSQAIGDSNISDNGTTVTIGSALNVTGAVTLSSPLTVANGGTGATTLGANGVLLGNGTSAISSLVAGGSGLCLTSTAGAPIWSACPGSGGSVSDLNTFTGSITIQGTTNQINVSNSTNTITLSTPQNINTGASPQFSGLTLTSDLAVNGSAITTTSTGTMTIFNTNAVGIDIGGAVDATGIDFAGGSASTGCTIDGSNGNLTCTGNITGGSTGTNGYFSRTGTTLSPANAGDNITTSGNLSTTGSGTITSAGVLTVSSGGISVTGNSTISGTLSGLTGLTVASGGATITGGIDNNSGGITEAGAVSGASTITASSTINTTGGALQTNSTDRITNSGGLTNITGYSQTSGSFAFSGAGAFSLDSSNFDVTSGGVLSGITGLTMASGNFVQNGTGTFGTGTGAVSLNGATTVSTTLAVTGVTSANGGLNTIYTRNNAGEQDSAASSGWRNIGTFAGTGSGARFKIDILGSSGYGQAQTDHGETTIIGSIANNSSALVANIQGSWYSVGGNRIVTDVKFVENGSRNTYDVYANFGTFSMHSVHVQTSRGTWTNAFSSVADPGADSASVKQAVNTYGLTATTASLTGNFTLTGTILNSTGNLVLDDTVDIGSSANGIRIDTAGSISDINGDIVLNDQVQVGGANGINITTAGVITDLNDASVTIGENLTISSGGATITGGIDNNSGGITEAGAVSGASTITASSTINTTGGALQTNSTDRITNSGGLTNITGYSQTSGSFAFSGAGAFSLDSSNFDVTSGGVLSGITGLTMASGNFVQNGTGTFGTGTGAVSLNGATTVSTTLAVTGVTSANGGLNTIYTRNNAGEQDSAASSGWRNIGTFAGTGSGARFKIDILGSSGYGQAQTDHGETTIIGSIANNSSALVANIQGSWYSVGGNRIVTDVKFVENGSRNTYDVYANFGTFSMHSVHVQTSRGTWTNAFSSVADPGADSASVKQAVNTYGLTATTASLTGNFTLTGTILNSTGNLVLDDTVDIGSSANGIRIDTAGSISDINGDIVLNDQVQVGGANGINITTAGVITDLNDSSVAFGEDISVTGAGTFSGNLAVNGASITTTSTGTANLFNTNAVGLNIGGDVNATGILFAGGSASTGCTINGANGNLTCSGTVSGSTAYLAKNSNDTSSASFLGTLYSFTNTNAGAASVLSLQNSGTGATLQVTPSGNTSNSSSTGGAINLNNTNNTGAGLVIYSDQAAPTGPLLSVRADNVGFSQSAIYTSYDGTANAVNIVNTGTGASNGALNVTSSNASESTLKVSGSETGRGTIKVSHTGTGTDGNASAISIDLQGVGTAAQGIFIDATDGGTTGKILNLRNNGVELMTFDASGNLGLGTSGTNTAKLDVRGNALFRNVTNTTTAFAIQNATSGSLFNIDSTNGGGISLLANNSGALHTWTTNSNSLTASTSNAGTAYANGYVYVVGGDSAGITTKVEYAKVNANGSLGSFATSTVLPAAREDIMVVASNGYLYAIGGNLSATAQTTSYVAKLNKDGTISDWVATTALPAGRYASGVVAYNGYIYIVGGSSTASAVGDTYYAKQNADGTLGAWTLSANVFPAAAVRRGVNVTVANGYLYAVGGQSGTTSQDDLYYSKISTTNGSIGTWTAEADLLPGNRAWGALQVANGYLYYYGGWDGAAATNSVYYTQLNSDGTTTAWTTNTNNLPATRSDMMSFAYNGYLYSLGGSTSAVYYVSTPRITLGGGLDLVSLSGENLSEGGTGGSLTAGNTSIVGTLDVQQQANFWDNLFVNGSVNVVGGINVSGKTITSAIATVTTGGGLSNGVEGIAIQGKYAYVASYDESDLDVVDITDPKNPVVISSTDFSAAGINPEHVAVKGNYAYMPMSSSDVLAVIDISNPYAPTLVDSIATGDYPTFVAVSGQYAFVLNDFLGDSIYVYNIADPTNISLVSTFSTNINNPKKAFIKGQYMYVAQNNATSPLNIIDISNPSALASVDVEATATAGLALAVNGSYAYVSDDVSSIYVMNISNPSAIVEVTSVFSDAGVEDLVVQGRRMYGISNQGATSKLVTFDISNPALPVLIESVTTGNDPWHFAISGRYAYVPNYTNDQLQVFDLGEAYVQQLETGAIQSTTINVQDVTIYNNTTIGGSLTVAGAAQFQGDISVLGKSTFNGDLIASVAPTQSSSTQTTTSTQTTGDVGNQTRVALGTDGFAVISHYSFVSATEADMILTKCSNTACSTSTSVTIDGGSSSNNYGTYNDVAIGADGYPVIAYHDDTNDDLKVAKCSTADCSGTVTITSVDTTNDTGKFVSIAIAPDGNPVISYRLATSGDLRYTRCGNSACSSGNTTTSIETTNDVGWDSNVAISSDGLPIIVHYDQTNGDGRVFKCGNLNCTAGNTASAYDSTNDTGEYAHIVIGSDGLPFIAYNLFTNRALRVTKCGDTACASGNVSTTVDDVANNVAYFPRVAVGPDGFPIIIHQDESGNDVKVLKCGNLACSTGNTSTTVETTNDVGQESDIAIMPNGLPLLVYNDETNDDLRVTLCANNLCSQTSGGVFSGGVNIGSVGNYFNNVYAVNYYGKSFSIANFDLAEEYTVEDQSIMAGEIVAINPASGKLKRASSSDRENILGIVSTSPGLALRDYEANRTDTRLVALVGRVPLKIKGTVTAGDPITISASDGVGEKATKEGLIVGRALTSSTGATVEIFVQTQYYVPMVDLQGTEFAQLSNLTIGGTLKANSLEVSNNAVFNGNIIVFGHFITDGNTPAAQLATGINLGSNTTPPVVSVEGNDISGTVKIDTTGMTSAFTPGQTVKITFHTPYLKKPKIFLEPSNNNAENITVFKDISQTEFTIKITNQLAPNKIYEFDYLAVQ